MGSRLRRLAGWSSLALFVAGVSFTLLSTEAPRVALEAGGVHAEFAAGGPRLSLPHGQTLGLAFQSVGRGERTSLSGALAVEQVGDEVRYERAPGMTEWWRTQERGLEHGLTIADRPEGDGPLELAVAVSGTLHLASASGDSAMLANAEGTLVASYAGLVVTDRDGTRVPAAMRADHGAIVIDVDDARARYPLVVDPIVGVEEANLVLATRAQNDYFGYAVAMSADGTRVLVGAHGDDTSAGTDAGSARIYVRSGTTWTEETELVPTGAGPSNFFGVAVAMSADGTRVAVGRSGHDPVPGGGIEGGFVVFVRSGTTWTQEASVPGPALGQDWPMTLAITSDGSRVVAGSPTYATSWGHAIVYRRMTSAWSVEQELPVPVPAGGTYWGWGVAIAGDGTRVGVTLRGDRTAPSGGWGSVRVYRLVTGTWTPEATLFPSTSVSGDDDLLGGAPDALEMSGDGSRLVVGSSMDGIPVAANRGSATVFLRTGTTWAEEAVLIPPTAVTGDRAGYAVSMSSDGSRVLLTSPEDSIAAFLGAVGTGSVFDRAGTTWTHVTTFSPAAPINGQQCGYGAALAPDGTRAIMGCPFENVPSVFSYAGAAHVVRFENRDANGTPCSSAATCLSGFCADGVCCNSACGASATDDCQACGTAAGGVVDGTCGALTAAAAPTVTCRVAAGGCDVAEICTAASAACPTDAVRASGFECRPAAGGCDVPDLCNGSAPACPTDVLHAIGFVCRAALSVCDVDETCDGSARACPTDVFAAAGTSCRASTGTCDAAEGCTGLVGTCPIDAALDCNDHDACTADACDATTGCSHTAIAGCTAIDASVASDAGTGVDAAVVLADAGRDAGRADAGAGDASRTDASSGGDAGAPSTVMSGGCGCSVPGHERSPRGAGAVLLLGLVAATLRMRRRR